VWRCRRSAENTIACRGDLNPANGVYSLPSFAQRNHAATDAKIFVASQYDPVGLRCSAVSGPTWDQVPAFQFSTSPYANTPHLGMPDRWTFDWVTMDWSN
jgi:hypothetical protein